MPGAASGAWLLNGEGSKAAHEVLFRGVGVAPGVALVTPIPGQGILSFNGARLGAVLAGTHLTATRRFTVPVGLRCPVQAGSCTGAITLRTRGAVRTSSHQRRAAAVTLASAPFELAAGQLTTVRMRLTARARALLLREKLLRLSARLVSRGATGAALVTQTAVTLQVSRPARRSTGAGLAAG